MSIEILFCCPFYSYRLNDYGRSSYSRAQHAFIFGKFRVQISAGIQAILSKVFMALLSISRKMLRYCLKLGHNHVFSCYPAQLYVNQEYKSINDHCLNAAIYSDFKNSILLSYRSRYFSLRHHVQKNTGAHLALIKYVPGAYSHGRNNHKVRLTSRYISYFKIICRLQREKKILSKCITMRFENEIVFRKTEGKITLRVHRRR
jgi:hypothetical protein